VRSNGRGSRVARSTQTLFRLHLHAHVLMTKKGSGWAPALLLDLDNVPLSRVRNREKTAPDSRRALGRNKHPGSESRTAGKHEQAFDGQVISTRTQHRRRQGPHRTSPGARSRDVTPLDPRAVLGLRRRSRRYSRPRARTRPGAAAAPVSTRHAATSTTANRLTMAHSLRSTPPPSRQRTYASKRVARADRRNDRYASRSSRHVTKRYR